MQFQRVSAHLRGNADAGHYGLVSIELWPGTSWWSQVLAETRCLAEQSGSWKPCVLKTWQLVPLCARSQPQTKPTQTLGLVSLPLARRRGVVAGWCNYSGLCGRSLLYFSVDTRRKQIRNQTMGWRCNEAVQGLGCITALFLPFSFFISAFQVLILPCPLSGLIDYCNELKFKAHGCNLGLAVFFSSYLAGWSLLLWFWGSVPSRYSVVVFGLFALFSQEYQALLLLTSLALFRASDQVAAAWCCLQGTNVCYPSWGVPCSQHPSLC